MIGNACSALSAHGHDAISQSGRNARPDRSASAARLNARSEQMGTLQVKTAEGDTVSISFAGLQQLSAEGVSATGRGKSLNGYSASSSSAMAVEVKVNGSLNDDELADIQQLMKQLITAAAGNSVAPQLTEGNVETVQSYQFAYRAKAVAQYGAIAQYGAAN